MIMLLLWDFLVFFFVFGLYSSNNFFFVFVFGFSSSNDYFFVSAISSASALTSLSSLSSYYSSNDFLCLLLFFFFEQLLFVFGFFFFSKKLDFLVFFELSSFGRLLLRLQLSLLILDYRSFFLRGRSQQAHHCKTCV